MEDYVVPSTGRRVKNMLEMLSDSDNLYLLYADYLDNSLCYIEPRSINYNSNGDITKHWYTSGNLKLSKYRYGMSAVDLFESDELTQQISSVSVAVPDSIRSYVGTDYTRNYHAISTVGTDAYIVFYKATTIDTDEEFMVLKVNGAGETTVYNVTNTAGVKLNAGNRSFYITKSEYLVARGSAAPYDYYAINLLDNTDVIKIENPNQINVASFLRWNTGNSAYICNNSTQITYKIDVDAGLMIPLNGSDNQGNQAEITVINNPLLIVTSKTPSREDNQVLLYRSTTYLATINNLEIPVVKTASKTMKVTYTITF